jgi:hypothetical protein
MLRSCGERVLPGVVIYDVDFLVGLTIALV